MRACYNNRNADYTDWADSRGFLCFYFFFNKVNSKLDFKGSL